jgi:hypothetical protein
VDAPTPPKGEGIEFTVRALDAATGEPIPGVSIELTRAAAGGDRRTWRYKAQTDPGGKVTFTDVFADRYAIAAKLEGRILVAGSLQNISFPPGGKATPVIFRMHKSSIIEGIVEDRDRVPVPNSRVELLEERWSAGVRTLARVKTSEPTNAEGKFVIGEIMPGSYFLRARILPIAVRDQLKESDKAADPRDQHVAYVNTMYPAAPFLETAQPLLVYEGAKQQGVRIEIQKSKYYAVRGQVLNLNPEVRGPGLIFIRTVSFDSRFPFIADSPYDEAVPTEIRADGTFVYETGLPPGQYWAGYTPGGQGNRFGGTDFRVSDRDVDLKTELWKGFPFEGKVVDEEGKPASIDGTLRTFWDRRSIRSDQLITDRDGKFNRPLYSDGKFRLDLGGGSYAIKKIEKDGRTFDGPEFDVIAQGGPAVITVTKTGASIDGTVELHNSTKAYPRGMVTLSLDPLNPLDNPRRKRLDGIDSFKFEHLEAGRYRLCAWVEEGTEINRVLGNPNYDKRLATLCQSVEVKIDDAKTAKLKQISAFEIQ